MVYQNIRVSVEGFYNEEDGFKANFDRILIILAGWSGKGLGWTVTKNCASVEEWLQNNSPFKGNMNFIDNLELIENPEKQEIKVSFYCGGNLHQEVIKELFMKGYEERLVVSLIHEKVCWSFYLTDDYEFQY